jgi:hypothetical protein
MSKMQLIGIELFGKQPQSNEGMEFRASHFDWPKLWFFCCETAPTVVSDYNAHYGQFNDGGVEFDEPQALKLAGFLELAFETGYTETLIKESDLLFDKLIGNTCEICNGTGYMLDNEVVRCRNCAGIGKYTKKEVSKRFRLKLNQIQSLTKFLRNCGGFKIN